ncbi:MAG TPA: response regulator [Steroidobacteraceae bacterium]
MSTESPAAEDQSVEVLIVDDNEDAANSLGMLLELEDVGAAIAADAEAALRLLERLRPTLLLIDIGLPGMNGYELAKHVRKLPGVREATLIALTGRDAPADTTANGFDQFWTKPFDPKKLLEEIKALLDRKRACVPESGT